MVNKNQSCKNSAISCQEIAKMIDHTILKPWTTSIDIKKVCGEAIEHNFASVCIPPVWVSLAKELTNNSPVRVTTVIGFLLGYFSTKTKVNESQEALENGADELDMVINIGWLKESRHNDVLNDIKSVVEVANNYENSIVKVILEICYLTNEEIIKVCELSEQAKAHFVKTSTGYGKGDATIEAVKLMKKTVGNRLGIKASGGIKTLDAAISMVKAGATRIGTSSSVKIIS